MSFPPKYFYYYCFIQHLQANSLNTSVMLSLCICKREQSGEPLNLFVSNWFENNKRGALLVLATTWPLCTAALVSNLKFPIHKQGPAESKKAIHYDHHHDDGNNKDVVQACSRFVSIIKINLRPSFWHSRKKMTNQTNMIWHDLSVTRAV